MVGAFLTPIWPVVFAILTFVPLLLFLVVIHELGHYFTGRAFGVKVLEFGIGYPPRAFGFFTGRTPVLIDHETQFINLDSLADLRPGQLVKIASAEDTNGNLVARIVEKPVKGTRTKGPQSLQDVADEELLRHEGKVREIGGNSLVIADMIYSMNWTPLGGFVRLAGESNPKVPRSLASKGVGTRAIVLAAGAFMNAILPLFIFTIMFMIPHYVQVESGGDLMVRSVTSGSPALAAGIQTNDIITRLGNRPIVDSESLTRAIADLEGDTAEWVIIRDDIEQRITVAAEFDEETARWLVGISISLVEMRSDPLWVAIPRSVTETGRILVLLKQEVGSWISGDSSPDLSGPIGIAQITGEVTKDGGLRGWMVLAVLFSINLAILNILPVPMLDGGRLVFVVIEWIRRGKRVSPEKEGMAHLVGFVVLIALILLISANDIHRLIQGGSVLGGG